MTTPNCQQLLLDTLRQRGVPEALRVLNARVPHRYTAVYRLHEGLLTNLFLHDKLGKATPAELEEVPLDISFCQFVIRDGSFCTENSAADRRLDGNPYQGKVMAYHGVPVLDGTGGLYGTLCHFDLTSWGISDDEFAVLQAAAGWLAPYLPAPPLAA